MPHFHLKMEIYIFVCYTYKVLETGILQNRLLLVESEIFVLNYT